MIVTIDTGGTKTLISSFSAHGKIGESIKFPTPSDPSQYVAQLKKIVREQYEPDKVEVVVLAIPGVVDAGVIKWCGNLPWQNLDLGKKLHDLLPGVPLFIENDAKLAALGETRSLPSIPVSSLYVTISTGIGGGLVVDGKLDHGMRFSEIGHIPLEYDGKVRIWESFASGHAIVATYKQFARDITSKRTWRQIADRMSRGFLVVIPTIQPDIIIIGGSVGTYFERYGTYLRDILLEHLPPHIACPKIIQAVHPEEAVIYGCYYYGKDYLTSKKAKK
ncbi:ROK family protein [Candidatus Saccharibacteria bacterium]|nr:MAG: ROK family protein [Candidatus Saccharibacteria bacterium]